MKRCSIRARTPIEFGLGSMLVLATVVWAGCTSLHERSAHRHPQGASHDGSGAQVVHHRDDAAPRRSATKTEQDPEQECRCAAARMHNGWCESCAIGYVAGRRITSPEFYEALDAHGHAIDPASFSCATCLDAIETDGYCAAHRRGFVGGLLYFSDLTWSLARGRAIDVDELDCPKCRDHANDRGWCAACRAGQVGPVRFVSRQDFDLAIRNQDRLDLALVTLKRCEECAMRTFYPGRCATCGTDSRSLPGAADHGGPGANGEPIAEHHGNHE